MSSPGQNSRSFARVGPQTKFTEDLSSAKAADHFSRSAAKPMLDAGMTVSCSCAISSRLPLHLVKVSCGCLQALAIWKNPPFQFRGVPMGGVHHRKVIMTDASLNG